MTEEEKAPEPEGVPEFRSVIKDFSEEELETAKARARKLCAREGSLNQLTTTLIAARRTYALARLRLHQILEEQENCRWVDGTEEVILHSVEAYDEQPYHLGELATAMNNAVLPFVLDELQKAQEQQRTEVLRIEQAAEAERLSRKIPLCITEGRITEVDRGQIVLLCGTKAHCAAVSGTLAEVVKNNNCDESPSFYVVRLLATPLNVMLKKNDQHARVMVDIGVNKWLNTFTSTNKTHKMMDELSRLLAKPRVDLLVVEDVHSLSTGGPSWRKKGDNAVEALKSLGRWAKDSKSAVLGYVAFEVDEIEEQTAFITAVQSHMDIYLL